MSFKRIEIEKEEDAFIGLPARFSECLEASAISIHINIGSWISAYSLNLVACFIGAMKCFSRSTAIRVELIDNALVKRIRDECSLSEKEKNDIVRKLVFYEAIGLIETLQNLDVVVVPSSFVLEEIKEQLEAKKKPSHYRYSSRMLSLSPLIDNEAEQRQLATRIETLNSILFQNLKFRLEKSNLDLESIRSASNQIMFEMVKNIYQHGSADRVGSVQGFACAQINKHPLVKLKSSLANPKVVEAALETQKVLTPHRTFRWLSISICDFGIGIPERLRKFFYDVESTSSYGRFDCVDKDFISRDENLILLATTTDFSTKKSSYSVDEHFEASNGPMKLASKGYGLVFSLGFLARAIGRMRIVSGATEVKISVNPERSIDTSRWLNVETTAEQLAKNFDDNFIVELSKLEGAEEFPGTQILIEIPIEAATYGERL